MFVCEEIQYGVRDAIPRMLSIHIHSSVSFFDIFNDILVTRKGLHCTDSAGWPSNRGDICASYRPQPGYHCVAGLLLAGYVCILAVLLFCAAMPVPYHFPAGVRPEKYDWLSLRRTATTWPCLFRLCVMLKKWLSVVCLLASGHGSETLAYPQHLPALAAALALAAARRSAGSAAANSGYARLRQQSHNGLWRRSAA